MNRGLLLVFLSAAAYGLQPVLAKLAYAEGVQTLTLLTLRFSIAALFMWAIWGYRFRRGDRAEIRRAVLVPLILMGAVGFVGQSFAYFTATNLISASAVALLLYVYPPLVALLAWLIYREPLTLLKILALLLASFGLLMSLRLLSSLLGTGTFGLGELRLDGVAWALAAALIYSFYIIAGARFTANIAPVFSSAVIISSAALVYVVWSLSTGALNLSMTPLGLLWTAGIAILATVVAITLFFAGLSIVGPSRAAIVSTAEPAITIFVAGIVLNEAITVEQAIGGVLILSSVLILQLGSRAKSAEAPI
jgi:drug/metabolite transporter (DMT)-like permease